MSRIRTIKPEFWTSEQVMECSPLARLMFIGMWNFCDDQGVHPASSKTLKAEVFPGDDITSADVQALAQELINQGLIATFTVEGKNWWNVTGWHHQLIKNPSAPKYPAPPTQHTQPYPSPTPAIPQSYPSPTTALGEEYPQEGKGREVLREGKGKGKEGSMEKSNAPTRKTACPADLSITPELRDWAVANGYSDLERHLDAFKDKATAKGYQYANWQAALRNAIRDDWAGLRKAESHQHPLSTAQSLTPEGARFAALLNNLTCPAIEGELVDAIH